MFVQCEKEEPFAVMVKSLCHIQGGTVPGSFGEPVVFNIAGVPEAPAVFGNPARDRCLLRRWRMCFGGERPGVVTYLLAVRKVELTCETVSEAVETGYGLAFGGARASGAPALRRLASMRRGDCGRANGFIGLLSLKDLTCDRAKTNYGFKLHDWVRCKRLILRGDGGRK